MATVNKNFKVKNGLVVEGTTATVNNFDILTKKQADQDYIVGLIGGTATSANTPDTVVKRDGSGNFAAGTITATITGTVSSLSNHDTDDLAEGTNSLYFTNQRATDANTGLWDTIGSAALEAGYVASDLSNHEALTSGVHGVTGSVVGTTDTQILTNKTINDELYFTNPSTQANDGGIKIDDSNEDLVIRAYTADLEVIALGDVNIASTNGNINLNPDGNVFINGSTSADQVATQGYVDTEVGNVASDLSTHESATTGIHGVTGDIVGTTDAQTLSNKTLGSDLAAGGYKVSGLADPTANQDSATKAYVDGAVSALVDSAPALLDTLNELAAAIADNPNYASDIASSLGDKVAKAGDSMSGDLDFGGVNKVTSLAAPSSSTDAATKGYVDQEISDLDTAAQGYADSAETAANSYTDGRETAITTAYQSYADTAEADAVTTANSYTDGEITDALVTAQGYATTAEQNAIAHADALTTDDVAEGSLNEYFTDYRAKVSAVDLLTNASKSNIEITWTNQGGLVIAAENGVADSDTDDLEEGSTNLYFTDARAQGAINDTTPNFAAVEINLVAKQVAATTDALTAGVQTAFSWAHTDYRSAEFLVKVAYGDHTEISKVLLTLDINNNISITEYGIVGTNGSASSISATIDGTDVDLLVDTENNSSTITVVGTLLA